MPPYRVLLQRDLPVPMTDGVTLLADRYVPVGAVRPPTVLVRSPYGRRGVFGLTAEPPSRRVRVGGCVRPG
ncbi:hypothetical protein ACFV0L_39285 [Streptosporangium canum]|uniref:hypothetical protein n=1 Tax=Streptosporangium canum TaxID=324952 RepID=UPI0036A512CD